MRLREFVLTEYISLSAAKHAIVDGIADIADKKVSKQFIKGAGFDRLHEGSTTNDIRDYLNDLVQDLHYDIREEMSTVFSNVVDGSRINVEFRKMNVGGSAGYNTVTLNVDVVEALIDAVDKIVGLMIKNELVNDEYRLVDMKGFHELLRDMKYSFLPILGPLSSREMVETMVHELVHIQQHGKQQRGRTEYRSKLAGRDRFVAAIRAMHSGDVSDEDRKIYYSSLQEIPAHAHNAVMDILRGYYFPDRYVGTDAYSVFQSIGMLKKDMGNLSSGKIEYGSPMYKSDRLRYYNSTFNKPSDPLLYGVYKRFVKLVYQELVRYIEHWQSKLPKQSKSIQYDVYLDGKLIDMVSHVGSAEDAKDGLVNHDGYDPRIEVVKAGKRG